MVDAQSIVETFRNRFAEALNRMGEVKTDETAAVVQSAESGAAVPIHIQQRQYARIENLRREVEDLLAQIKAEVEKSAGPIMEAMAEAGMQRFTAEGLTCFIKRDRYVNKATDATQTEMIAILREYGLGHLVAEGYNAAKLKSHVLEKLDEEADLPEALMSRIKVGEILRLATQVS